MTAATSVTKISLPSLLNFLCEYGKVITLHVVLTQLYCGYKLDLLNGVDELPEI
jgi:hypothetical protein